MRWRLGMSRCKTRRVPALRARLLLISALLISCVTKGPIDREKLHAIEAGKTTFPDVQRLLGKLEEQGSLISSGSGATAVTPEAPDTEARSVLLVRCAVLPRCDAPPNSTDFDRRTTNLILKVTAATF